MSTLLARRVLGIVRALFRLPGGGSGRCRSLLRPRLFLAWGIAAGLLALAIPGIILMLRWVVVAQSAAIEHEG